MKNPRGHQNSPQKRYGDLFLTIYRRSKCDGNSQDSETYF